MVQTMAFLAALGLGVAFGLYLSLISLMARVVAPPFLAKITFFGMGLIRAAGNSAASNRSSPGAATIAAIAQGRLCSRRHYASMGTHRLITIAWGEVVSGNKPFGGLQVNGYQLTDPLLSHRHSEQAIHPAHRDRVVGDDQETRVCPAGHFVEKVTEAGDVRVIKWGIDFVEHTDRRGVGQEDREDQRQRRQRLFTT